ncbi:MAG: putative zinc-binding metallopeptidase [Planctomycetales bacterium]|nr:putative zinc-binding metallopeptidase [Planctomycetales bacterium]
MTKQHPGTARKSPGRKQVDLNFLTDDELLNMRMCDLGLTLAGSSVEPRIEQLYFELAERGIFFRPHCWLSDEWFSPDGVPGIAIPFYLAHPRLMRLERKMMLEAEGGTQDWCMKILRHEAGHAIDTAFRLRRRKSYREMFGRVSVPYPDFYRPKPYSRNFVLHLDMWYAQSHPVEDFAETFAVWLRPRSRWRIQYRDWPALKKLEYVDRELGEIKSCKPVVTSRAYVDPLRTIRRTLREHYFKKREHYGVEYPSFYDRDLRRLFSDRPEDARRPLAAAFLRRARTELRKSVSKWTGEYQYTIDQVLSEMIERCRELKLRLSASEEITKQDLMILLTVQTMNFLHEGHHRVAL